jgi:hypothetical protein
MPYTIATYPEPTMAPGFATARVDVATLHEARSRVNRMVLDAFDGPVTPELKRLNNAAYWIPEDGGDVGPLPNGSVIGVSRVDR